MEKKEHGYRANQIWDTRKDCVLQSHTGRSSETRETAPLLQTALLAEGVLVSH